MLLCTKTDKGLHHESLLRTLPLSAKSRLWDFSQHCWYCEDKTWGFAYMRCCHLRLCDLPTNPKRAQKGTSVESFPLSTNNHLTMAKDPPNLLLKKHQTAPLTTQPKRRSLSEERLTEWEGWRVEPVAGAAWWGEGFMVFASWTAELTVFVVSGAEVVWRPSDHQGLWLKDFGGCPVEFSRSISTYYLYSEVCGSKELTFFQLLTGRTLRKPPPPRSGALTACRCWRWSRRPVLWRAKKWIWWTRWRWLSRAKLEGSAWIGCWIIGPLGSPMFTFQLCSSFSHLREDHLKVIRISLLRSRTKLELQENHVCLKKNSKILVKAYRNLLENPLLAFRVDQKSLPPTHYCRGDRNDMTGFKSWQVLPSTSTLPSKKMKNIHQTHKQTIYTG